MPRSPHRPQPPSIIVVEGEYVRLRCKPLGAMREGYRWGGEYDHETRTIRYAPGLTLGQERVVVLHELLHHLVRRAGLKLRKVEEERVLDSLDAWLLEALRANPDLVTYLCGATS